MEKDDYLRLLEKVIDKAPDYLTAIAGLITALNIRAQNKKRQPKTRQRKR